jgi:hypothetical protein
VAGSTKLFQRAGSPLIQGRSRYARSFWVQWAGGVVPSGLLVYAALAGVTFSENGAASFSSMAASGAWLLRGVGGLGGAALGSALGAGVARGMGWRRAWVAGAIVGAVAGVLVMLWTRQAL